jgi:hypothetical protein
MRLRAVRAKPEEEEPQLQKARVSLKMKEPSPGPPLAKTPAIKLDKFRAEFEAEMDEILIKPECFDKWEEYFKEEIPEEGDRFEELVSQAMDKLRGKVVPQLIGLWLFVLGNACKNARLKQMRAWQEIVGAYHALT